MRGAVLLAACVAAGCGADRLNFEKTFTLPTDEHADLRQFELPAQKGEQSITVEYSSAGDPVDVFVVFDKERDGFDALSNEAREKKSAASARGSASGKLPATIPANTKYSVVVAQSKGAGKKSEIKVKITN